MGGGRRTFVDVGEVAAEAADGFEDRGSICLAQWRSLPKRWSRRSESTCKAHPVL